MNTQSVILIHPAYDWASQSERQLSVGLPLSLLYLAGAIRDICTDVTIFDAYIRGNDDAKLDRLLQDKQPFIVGINCLFSGNFPEVRRLASFVKRCCPSTKVVLGGLHPTLYAREIMANCPDVDVVCLAEADHSFPKLLHYYREAAAVNAEPPKTLGGVAMRIGDCVIFRENEKYIEAVDDLPRPGYEFVNFDNYQVNTTSMFNPRDIKLNGVMMPLLTSRGCPNQCNFCAVRFVAGTRFRVRSAQNVFEEIRHLHYEYGINYFNIADDNFSYNKDRTLEICNLIVQSGLNIYLNFWNGLMIRTLDQEVIDAMCAAGGIRFSLAIESGSDFIRNKVMRKLCSREKIIEVASALKKHDVLVNTFFMLGFPEETEETIQDSIDLINEMDMVDTFTLCKVKPLPGTKLFDQCKRDGLFLDVLDENELWKGESELSRSLLDGGGGAGNFMIKPYALSVDKLIEYDRKITEMILKRTARIAAERMRQRLAARKKAI